MESDTVAVRFAAAAPAFPDGAWIVAEGYLDQHGEVVPPGVVAQGQANCVATTEREEAACLRAIGVTRSYYSYHPAERFWRFQLTEAAIVLGLLAAALALGPVGMRRRVR